MIRASPVARSKRLLVIELVVAFALIGVVGVLSFTMTTTRVRATAWVEHTFVVIETIGDLRQHMSDAELGVPGARDAALQDERLLRTLTADNPRQQARLDRVGPLVLACFARPAFDVEAMSKVRPILAEMTVDERALLVEREAEVTEDFSRGRLVQVVGAGASMAVILMAFAALRAKLRRRARVDLELQSADAAIRNLNEELELRVGERTAELERVNRELETFSYSVAHDLRAPLRGISGFSEMLLEDYQDKLDDDGRDCLFEICDNTRRMSVLIDALLSLSQVTRAELSWSDVDLAAVVRSTIAELRSADPRPSLVLVVAEDAHAELDPRLAHTLIDNLIGNAWKFTAKVAVPRIELGVTEVAGQRTFFVRDNGAGFDAAHAMKLFAPFHRLHTVAEFAGTGIGLSTAQRIVTRFGGRIWAEGKVGEGATFFFTFADQPEGHA